MNTIFVECFGDLEDPRVDRTKKHLLLDVVAIGLCGVIVGCESWDEIADFGRAQLDWFSQFLALPHGAPSHDTISRVFAALDPKSFQGACLDWFKQIQTLVPETVVAIDGKTLRGSARHRAQLKGLHIVNAWSCANAMSLGQLKVDDKTNEITVVPKLLEQLFLEGAIVTLDAMGCQHKTISEIIRHGADYVVAVKKNQKELYELITDSFSALRIPEHTLKSQHTCDELNADHGRIEQREVTTIEASELKRLIDQHWEKLSCIVRVIAHRDEVSQERFYISSLPYDKTEIILNAIRSHWQIENNLHWVLDVSFSEDKSRVRDEVAAQNLSWARKFAIGLLNKEDSFKASIRRKQRKACMQVDYLARVISNN